VPGLELPCTRGEDQRRGFGVWFGDPFHDTESEQFVARCIERAPLSLEKLSRQDDIVTYTTKDGAAHEFDTLEFLAELSAHIPKTYERDGAGGVQVQ
jgi:hypothetical protein